MLDMKPKHATPPVQATSVSDGHDAVTTAQPATPAPAPPAALMPVSPGPPTPAMISQAQQALEKKREYDAMRQRAIDELLNVIGKAQQQCDDTIRDAKQQLAELGWNDPTVAAVPTVFRRPGRPPGRPRTNPRLLARAQQRRDAGAEHIPVVPTLRNKVCPKCGQRGHDARSHRRENLAEIANGQRTAKR